MSLDVRLLICRFADKLDPSEPDHLGFVAGGTRSLRGQVMIDRVSVPDILRDLRDGRAAYRTASVGQGRDKLGVVPAGDVHRVVDATGAELLSSEPDAVTPDPLAGLPTAAQVSRWILRHCPTM